MKGYGAPAEKTNQAVEKEVLDTGVAMLKSSMLRKESDSYRDLPGRGPTCTRMQRKLIPGVKGNETAEDSDRGKKLHSIWRGKGYEVVKK